jgi:hypothetical protein
MFNNIKFTDMKKIYTVIPLLLISFLIIYFTIEAYATSTGRVMRTSTFDGGCGGTNCHANTLSTSTTLSLVSGSLLVDPNTTNSYTVRVSNSTLVNTGINIAVKTTITGATNIGTLEAPTGSGLQVLVDELAHSTPKALSGGNSDYTFNWTAPAKPGKYFLRACGLASNDDKGGGNDQWNWMVPQEVIVRGIELTEPLTGASACTGNNLNVKWTSAGIDNVKIELSTDGGNTWGITLKDNFIALGGSWTWSIPSNFQQGNQFRIRVSDVTGAERKSEMTGNFGIYGQFSITQHPESKSMCPGESIKLYVNTTGTGLKYQWRKNGFNLAGQTDSVLNLNNVNAGTVGFYGVVVSSNCYSPIVSNESDIQVRTPTIIKKQPNPIIACPGTNPTFQIDYDGHQVKLQWYKNNRELTGATEATLQIKNVSESDVDDYYCEVTGFCGVLKSNVVSLTLNQAPAITTQPVSKTACEKANVTFTLAAKGLQNSYEWYLNDKKISTLNTPNLVINNITTLNAGTYHCIVKNSCGDPVKSETVQLTVNLLPKITSQPQNRMVMVGDEVTFAVTAQNALTYQWKKDGKNITDAKESSITIDSATTADNGDYECVITNDCGSITSNKVNLLVTEPEPGPRAKFNSLSIDFGDIFLDNSIDSVLVGFITNNGNQPLLIDSIRIKNTVDSIKAFEIVFKDSTILAPKESIDLNVKFKPDTIGRKSAKITVYSNSIGEVPFIETIGDGAKYDVVSNRSQIDFESVIVNESDSIGFRIFNQSDYDITWLNTEFDCADGSDFAVSLPVLPAKISAKSSQDINLVFTPTKAINYDCFMNINFFGTSNHIKVKVIGKGTGTDVNENNNISKFDVYPNPTNNLIVFDFTIANSSEYKIDIYDINGNIVLSKIGTTNTNTVTYTWDTKDMNGNFVPSGSYRAVVSTGESTKSLNLLLVK